MSKLNPVDNQKYFNFFMPRLQKLSCTSCQRQFPESNVVYVPGKLIPLVMPCGHLICNNCDHLNPNKHCSLCKDTAQFDKKSSEPLPLHLYALGTALLLKYESNFGEPYFNTSKYISQPQDGSQVKANCYQCECECEATLYCKKCDEFFCKLCSSKKHEKAGQNHIVICLNESESPLLMTVSSCDNNCTKNTFFYCCKCDLNLCVECFPSHMKHEYLTLLEMNYTVIENFLSEYRKAAENKQRIHQAIQVSVLFLFYLAITKEDEIIIDACSTADSRKD
ncbi:hypothetical protein M0804_014610 [Polistes exclamans]|nr:hypothetical protein M0804_014621 [Polistes exclamans]KAI4474902.1 hypothetical protein M0804_014610 [Polistes exclamans]